MTKEEMKNRISMALKDPILQQGFEIICKNLAELESRNDKLVKMYNEVVERQNSFQQSLYKNTEELEKENAELKKIEEEYYDFIQKKNEEDWKGDNVVGCLKLKIEQLKSLIEKMKCCQNCIFMDFSQPNYCEKGVYRERQYVCDKWKFGN